MAAPASTLETVASFLPSRYRRHAKKIGIGFVVACSALVAIGAAYASYRTKQLATINSEFSAMKSAIDGGDLTTAAQHYEIVKDEGASFQANIAAFHMAYGYFENEDYATAESLYEEVIDRADTIAIKDAARLRYAKVLLAQGKNPQALDTLLEIESPAQKLLLLTENLVGDIHVLENNLAQALEAYARARVIAENLGDEAYLEALETRRSMTISLMLQQGIPSNLEEFENIEVLLPVEELDDPQDTQQDGHEHQDN